MPAYNESKRIGPMIGEYCRTLVNTGTVTVVANACTDDTVRVIQRLMERYDNLQLLNINGRIGKGGAIRAGLKLGSEPFIGFADADGSTSAAEFLRLFEYCRARGLDGVIGSRWVPGAIVRPKQPVVRRLASRMFNVLVRSVFALPFSDTQCGAKIFRREAVREVLPSLEIADFSFDIDLLFKLARRGLRIAEVPTVWCDRMAGTKVRLVATSLSMMASVVRLRLQESWLWRLPFADMIARRSVIPVKSSTRIMLLCDGTGRDHWVQACIASLGARGCTVLSPPVPGRSRLRTLFWYIFKSRREFDAILEVRSARPALIPAFSAKRCFLLETDEIEKTSLPAAWQYEHLYRRAHRMRPVESRCWVHMPLGGHIVLPNRRPETVADYIIQQIDAAGLYRATFHVSEEGWDLRFSDLNSGVWTLQDLK